MIYHFIKLIWNRKRRNFLTVVGVGISFFVMFLVATSLVHISANYLQPLGFEFQNVWFLTLDWKDAPDEEVRSTLEQIENALNTSGVVHFHAYSRSYLFMPSATSTTNLEYGEKEMSVKVLQTGDQYAEVLHIPLLQGRWFDFQDNDRLRIPVVINRRLQEELLPDKDPVGKILISDDKEMEIIGVIERFRNGGIYSTDKPTIFRRIGLDGESSFKRLVSDPMMTRLLFRVDPGTGMDFERALIQQINAIARNWTIKVKYLEDEEVSANRQNLIFPLIWTIVSGFLLINVALGLFGIIWYNTQRRRSEIGLRKAVGSTTRLILVQIVGEALVLTVFGMLIGSLFAVQFPLLGVFKMITAGEYISAYISTVLLIALIGILCALYPAWQASIVQPAQALHEE